MYKIIDSASWEDGALDFALSLSHSYGLEVPGNLLAGLRKKSKVTTIVT